MPVELCQPEVLAINAVYNAKRSLSKIKKELEEISKYDTIDSNLFEKVYDLWKKEVVIKADILLGSKSDFQKICIIRGIGINYIDKLDSPKKVERTTEIIGNLGSASPVESRKEVVTLATLIESLLDLHKKNFDFSKVKNRNHKFS